METAIIAAITSLVVSLLTLFQSLRNQQMQRDQFEKGQKRNLTSRLYDLRLQHYPRGFEITEWIQKTKGENLDPEILMKVVKELSSWKSGIVSLIISGDALWIYHDFRDALTKNPGEAQKYSKEQVAKIWRLRTEFRRSLRRDIGLLHREDRTRERT